MLRDNDAERVERMKELREMSREDRIIEVIGKVLSETEVEWQIGNLRKNKTKRTIDDLSKLYIDAKHTFHVLMCQLGQMQTYEHIMNIYGENVHEENLRETTMKLLIRCTYGFESIERCRIIFKMQKRHLKLKEMLKLEEKVAEARIDKKRLN